MYHIKTINNAKEAWDKLAELFGKVDEEMGFTIETNLLKLEPRNFDTIQDYLNKVNDYRAQLDDCGNPIKDAKLVSHLLKHLPPEYGAFVSSYNTHKLTMGSAFIKPSFESFSEMLVLEQEKLISMGILKSSTSKALVANHESQGNQSQKKKKNWKSKSQQEGTTSTSTQHDTSTSPPKGESSKKEKRFCAYCKKDGHEEHFCYKKDIDELKNLLAKNNIKLPSRMSTSTSSSPNLEKDKGKGHAFVTQKGQALYASSSPDSGRWLLDSGASHHMASSQSMFSSFEPCKGPPILMGNHTYMNVIGKGSIDVREGHFNDVLCVPHLTNNLLSIYQITNGATKKTVEFTPDSVFIKDLESGVVIYTRMVDHSSWLYSFVDFVPLDGSDSS